MPFAINENRWGDIASNLKTKPVATDDLVLVLGILVGIGLLIWLLSYALSLRERRRNYASPLRLFISLCRAHRLKWGEGWLLWQLARAQQLRDPARLFLEPERLAPAGLPLALRLRAPLVADLQRRLFALPPEGLGKKAENAVPPAAAAPLPADASSAEPGSHGPSAERPSSPTPALDVPPWTG